MANRRTPPDDLETDERRRRRRRYLSEKLDSLMQESGAVQTDLRQYGIGQGTMSDHLNMHSYPKFPHLLTYAKFFSEKCGRMVTLLELTGEADLAPIEGTRLSPDALRVARAFDSMPSNHPIKRGIINMLLEAIDKGKEAPPRKKGRKRKATKSNRS